MNRSDKHKIAKSALDALATLAEIADTIDGDPSLSVTPTDSVALVLISNETLLTVADCFTARENYEILLDWLNEQFLEVEDI